MGAILSKKEIQGIERHIDEINARGEWLDPTNPFEARMIDNDQARLREYLVALEASMQKARRQERGLRLVG